MSPSPRISKAARASHLDTMEALLVAEAATLEALRAATAPLMRLGIATDSDAVSAARRGGAVVEDGLISAAAQVRAASLEAMRREFAVARTEAIAAGVEASTLPPSLPGSKHNDDATRARRAAETVRVDALKRARRLLDSRPTFSSVLPDHVLETTAATETANIFHDEREQIERIVVQRYRGTDWLPAMIKIQDATLDVRTCAKCRELDGQIRPFGIGFGIGLPVHSRCRCTRPIIFSVLYMGRSLDDAA